MKKNKPPVRKLIMKSVYKNLTNKNRIVRGTLRDLKGFCKAKNFPTKWIRKDAKGYYIKLGDRGRGKN